MTKIIYKPFSRFLIVLLSCLCWSGTVAAQYTLIPDPAFEAYLIRVNIDSDNLVNGQVLTSDIAGRVYLDIERTSSNQPASPTIYDLTGIEDFAALEYLRLSGHAVSTLDLSQNTALEDLYIDTITTPFLDLSALSNLEYLTVEKTQVDSLQLPIAISQLKEVILDKNNFRNVDFTSSPLLEYLLIRDSDINQLDVSSNLQLHYLYLHNTLLSTLDVSRNTELYSLQLENMAVSAIDLTRSTLLEEVALRNVGITALDLSACDTLYRLSLIAVPLSSDSLYFDAAWLRYLKIENPTAPFTELDLTNASLLNVLILAGTEVATIDAIGSENIEYVIVYENSFLNRLRLGTGDLLELRLSRNAPDLYLCFANTLPPLSIPIFVVDCAYGWGCYPNLVEGQVNLDTNNNCALDRGERQLANYRIEFQRAGNAPYVAVTDVTGRYQAHLDTGTYIARIIAPNAYQQACIPVRTVVVDSTTHLDTLDWHVQAILDCAEMWVDIGSPLLRTPTPSYYVVNYCNQGTIAADSVYVEILLDPAMTFLYATQDTTLQIPTSQIGQTLRFDLGRVEASACDLINVYIQLDTSVFMGQTHCTEAHIYPDTSCWPAWAGPILDVEGVCLGDSIAFTIVNQAAAMVQQNTYFVFEDNIMMRQGTVQLGGGASQVVHQVVNAGKTYRLSVAQSTGFPKNLGDSIATAALEGCKPLPDGSFNTGFITQFSNGSSAAFLVIDCQQNVGSYDPNDKAAQPTGYDPLYHYLEKNTAIDYKIRFQNTGTDTAFNVVILDTLSPFLDVTTLQMGASSHAYTWSIQNGNILRVAFNNIMLPDSNVNEPLSNGFFRYRIAQKLDNPLGSVINNTAAIYFDYNPPIFTNTTFHTIGENFITAQVIAIKELKDQVTVLVSPNPFAHTTTLTVEGQRYTTLRVSVFDGAGRLLRQDIGQGDRLQLSRGNLPAGLYFYRLEGDGEYLATGKIIVR